MLWWSEDQAVRFRHLSARALSEAVEMTDISKIDPALDGKLVHACGEPECQTELEDPLLGLRVKALTYNRRVQYYQLTESKHTRTTDEDLSEDYYTYDKIWTNSPVPSGGFHDFYYKSQAKPPVTTVKNLKQQAQNASFGAYRLPASLMDSYEGSAAVSFDLSEETKNRLAQELKVSAKLLHKTDSGIYIGANPGDPALGDVSITLACAPVSEISLIAAVKGDSLERFRDSSEPDDVYLSKIMPGRVSLEEMIEEINRDEAFFDWLMRGFSLVITLLGSAFMPWQRLTGLAPVRLLLNGSAADGKDNRDWSILSVARVTLALLLLTAGLTWLSNDEAIIGGALLTVSAALYLLPFTERRHSAAESRPEKPDSRRQCRPSDSEEQSQDYDPENSDWSEDSDWSEESEPDDDWYR